MSPSYPKNRYAFDASAPSSDSFPPVPCPSLQRKICLRQRVRAPSHRMVNKTLTNANVPSYLNSLEVPKQSYSFHLILPLLIVKSLKEYISVYARLVMRTGLLLLTHRLSAR